ncbi:transcription-repair coupling factor [Roseburia sp. CAG:303]|nr:transcription-repair coupling factor [Roseburia sp. CAG:303]
MNTYFTAPLSGLNDYNLIKSELNGSSVQSSIQVTGAADSGMTHFSAALGSNYKYKVIVTFSDVRAREIYDDMKSFDPNTFYYPPKDFIFFSADAYGNLIIQQRLDAVSHLISGEEFTLITTIDGLMDRLVPLDLIRKNCIHLSYDDTIDVEELKTALVNSGFERTEQVETAGQFAVRGGIIDIFPMTGDVPYRIELWDDVIDSIRSFDALSQRTIENIDDIVIYPASEYILSQEEIARGIEKIREEASLREKTLRESFHTEEAHRLSVCINEFTERLSISRTGVFLDSFMTYFYPETMTLPDYFPAEETIFFIDEPGRIEERANTVETEFRESMINRIEGGYMLSGQTGVFCDTAEALARLASVRTVLFTTLEQKLKHFKPKNNYYISMRNINPYNNSFELLVHDLQRYKKEGWCVLILCGSRSKAARLADTLFHDYELNAFVCEDPDHPPVPGEILLTSENIHRGFEYPLLRFALISESDVFGSKKKRKKKKSNYSGEKINTFSDLKPGDYVIHENHGLGIYRGIEKIVVDKLSRDYIKIEYGDGGNLYVPATQLDLIQKHSGNSMDGESPKLKLNKLGSSEWSKTKSKVRRAVRDIAVDLVKLYAERQAKSGFQFSPDTIWQTEFEEQFPYTETDDQMTAIEDTKKDMESKKIMDRLICGDVGYGKTEVAIRAAFKAIQDGKQVAFLVPTTILAQQHYNTFTQRMKDFPVTVELMSRFRTPAQQKQAIAGLKSGHVDIVIGTHRILSKDIIFKDLGLLIIDEEQRFGVGHKEKIKQLKSNVDVLSLSATPIPRTLHMSLIGIRDMSVLEEPPVDRLPIQTYVMEFNEEMIREAINRELARNGQVYYVYNRVNNIEEITNEIQKLVPDAVVRYAHGQMSERKLEQIMYEFINGEIDVLVSTTIIETGLDISNVNTMIIHDADKLGLSQLYQLRGRVGRSNRTSYAFLMYKRDKTLKEIAEKRLAAIREFTDLGSGFKIAMRDLEIRGAGNILGAEQHGHMDAVGYDLYCKMLNEAVLLLKGEKTEDDTYETTIDVKMDAYIPPKYIGNEIQKLAIYKRIASIENLEEYQDMQDELTDRFGDIPSVVDNLLKVALIKSSAHAAGMTEISGDKNTLVFHMHPHAHINTDKIPELINKYRGDLKFSTGNDPFFTYKPRKTPKNTKEILAAMQLVIDEIS